MHSLNTICVYGGSQAGTDPQLTAQIQVLGKLLAEQKLHVIYGGGSTGLMGVLADAVLDHGGTITGIIPQFLARSELLHAGLTETIVTEDMHTRKQTMASRSDAFIAMPGGLGTFEELFEILTWAQLGVHNKPIGILNCAGFYDRLKQLIDHAVEAGFVRPQHAQLYCLSESAEELLQLLKQMDVSHYGLNAILKDL